MTLPPLGEESYTVRLDLVGPSRQGPHQVGEFGDLAVSVEGEPVVCQRGDPARIGERCEVAPRIHHGLQPHRYPRVDIRPPSVLPENLDPQPQVAMDVRIEGP
jgi:hypothetical protein